MPFLEILNGSESGTRFDLDHATTFLGRDPNNHCVLTDRTVSRKHAVINKNGENWVLSDLKSLKGLLVNGEKIGETELEDGDELTLGAVRLRFHLEEGSYRTPVVPFRPGRTWTAPLLAVFFGSLLAGSLVFYHARWGFVFPPPQETALPDSEVALREHFETGLRYFNEEKDFEGAKSEFQLVMELDPEGRSPYARKASKLLNILR